MGSNRGYLLKSFLLYEIIHSYSNFKIAGYGSVLNEDGEVEMDAALMDGRNLELGGVTGVGKRLIYHISRTQQLFLGVVHKLS